MKRDLPNSHTVSAVKISFDDAPVVKAIEVHDSLVAAIPMSLPNHDLIFLIPVFASLKVDFEHVPRCRTR